jgi:hypothetical protein
MLIALANTELHTRLADCLVAFARQGRTASEAQRDAAAVPNVQPQCAGHRLTCVVVMPSELRCGVPVVV